jgi:hypothetical protein
MARIFEILSKLEKLSVIEAPYASKDVPIYSFGRLTALSLISLESGLIASRITFPTASLLEILNIAFQP